MNIQSDHEASSDVESEGNVPAARSPSPRKGGADKMKTPKPSSAKKKKSSAASNGSKTPSTPGGPPGSKTYVQLAHEAIESLKDRTGSSSIAIGKKIISDYPEMDENRLKKQLLLSLKNGVKSKRFVKIKSSYKIHPDFKEKERSKAKKSKAKAAAAAKKKKAAEIKKQEAEKKKKLSKAQMQALKEKQEREKKEKERLDRIKKRKFPMDDLALIAEDRELKVQVDLPPRPTLPLVISDPVSASASTTSMQGIVEDILHIYHFFRGDVGWARLGPYKNSVAPFTLNQLVAAVQHVLQGHAKQSRMVPPLLSHLFCVCLQYLTRDLPTLHTGLTPASWGEILALYMYAMDKYVDTDMQPNANKILTGLPIDTDYLMGVTDTRTDDELLDEPETESGENENAEEEEVESSGLYFEETTKQVVEKLLNGREQKDVWALNASELLALLRTLCDDLMTKTPLLEAEMDDKMTSIFESLKKKRAADAHFRKLFNTRKKELADAEKELAENNTPGEEGQKPPQPKTKSISVSEAKLERARKEQEKANSAYEKECWKGRVRTEPSAFDRNFNAAWTFPTDPEHIWIQEMGPMTKQSSTMTWTLPHELRTHKTTWFALEKKSTLEAYLNSLDTRGKRESELYDAIVPCRRHVFDDVKEKEQMKSKLRELKDLSSKLENARLKVEGRKSGRLAGQTEKEYFDLQTQMEALKASLAEDESAAAKASVVKPIDVLEATGVNLLQNFERGWTEDAKKRSTRRDMKKQQKEDSQEDHIPKLRCSEMLPTGLLDGTGALGAIAAELIQLEKRANSLCSWDKHSRESFMERLEKAVAAWNDVSPPVLQVDASGTSIDASPNGKHRDSMGAVGGVESSAKKRKMPGTPSSSSNLTSVWSFLVEMRVSSYR